MLLLLRQFTVTFVYNIMSTSYKLYRKRCGHLKKVVVAKMCLCLDPVASFVADIKLGRFKTLVSSTYFRRLICSSIYN